MAEEKVSSHSRDVENFFYTNRLPQYQHPNISIGDYTYGIPSIRLMPADAKITIGKFCSIAPGVTFLMGGNHRADWISTYPFAALRSDWPKAKGEAITYKGNITVCNDVWLGTDVVILSGVTIGDGAVIGAETVVTKDIAPYSVVVGNPCREIRKRFDEQIISRLLEIQWWHWNVEKIQAYAHLIFSDNVHQFLENLNTNVVTEENYATL